MPDPSARARTIGAVLLALLFALFAFWCGLRAAEWWVVGARGQAIVAALAMLGGFLLSVGALRRALAGDGPPPTPGGPGSA